MPFWACLTLLVCLPLGPALGQLLRYPDPEKRLSQFLLRSWTTTDGLSSNSLIDITQTQDGYLWMASFDGLIQFDGVNFHTFGKKEMPQLRNNSVLSLVEGVDGTLWLGTQGSGLISYKEGKFNIVNSNLLMKNMMLDGSRIWIGTQDRGAHVYDLQQQAFSEVSYSALQDITVNAITRDQTGRIWFATEGRGLVSQFNGEFSVLTESEEHVTLRVCNEVITDGQGTVWIGSNDGLFYFEKGALHHVKELDGYTVRRIVIDRAGNMWIATGVGLFRKSKRFGFEKLPIDDDNTEVSVQDIAIDREGSLWFTTYRNGLFHLRDGKFTNFTYRDGLASKAIGSLCEFDSGKYLIGSVNGKMNIVDGNKIRELKTRFELPKDRIYHLMRDSRKNIWVCTYQGLFVIRADGKEEHFEQSTGLHDNLIRHAFEDSKGRIWIGSRSKGVAIFDLEQKKIVKHISTEDGLASNFILSIKEDREGNILIGSVNGGLDIIKGEQVIKNYKSDQGLTSNVVFSTFEDSDGVLWLATNAGFSRIENGEITKYTTQHGLPDEAIFDFLEDVYGNVWLPSNVGIIGVDKESLTAFAKDTTLAIPWKVYDQGDGMYSAQCAGATHSVIGNDGTIWIPTFGGVVKIIPSKIGKNNIKPPVHVNRLLVDGVGVDIYQDKIIIPPGPHRFNFGFSGLSMLSPKKVKFQYQITDYDDGWLEETYDRAAIYTNLPPGEHTFQVIAANNDGLWNKEGAAITFIIEPYFTQTIWFYLLLLLALGIIIILISQWRTKRVKRRNQKLEQEIENRTKELKYRSEELSRRNEEITATTSQLSSALNKMTDSVRYAQRIQQAILGETEQITSQFGDGFITLLPRDIVSGDFYWYAKKFGYKILIAADCTGHGVPGAFMTVMGNDVLNEIVNHHGIVEPDAILRELDRSIQRTLHNQDSDISLEDSGSERQNKKKVNDGMDIAVLCINDEDWEFSFAGAKNPLYIVRDGNLIEVKGSRFPIGGRTYKQEKIFEKHKYKLERGDIFYMFSDGYQDQFGGKFNRKFMKKRFREMLESISHLPMEEQKVHLQETLERWKGNYRQTDDILVMGVKI